MSPLSRAHPPLRSRSSLNEVNFMSNSHHFHPNDVSGQDILSLLLIEAAPSRPDRPEIQTRSYDGSVFCSGIKCRRRGGRTGKTLLPLTSRHAVPASPLILHDECPRTLDRQAIPFSKEGDQCQSFHSVRTAVILTCALLRIDTPLSL